MAAFHISCYEQKNGYSTKSKFPSRYESHCGICGSLIKVGEMMSWTRNNGVPKTEAPSIIIDDKLDVAEESAKMTDQMDPVTTALSNALIPTIDKRIEAKTKDFAKSHTPQVREIEIKRVDLPALNIGKQHRLFETLLKMVQTGLNVWIAGPAGSGKTTAAKNVAKALEKKFHYTGAVSDPFALLGFTDANGKTTRPAFREAFEHGGVFLFDEIDASDPNALAALHAAIENGVCAFPDTVVDRHADFILIASANTYGHGGTHEYVGRNKLDGATLDRYVVLEWCYDEDLELDTAPNPTWTKRVQALRKRAAEKGLRILITPRASYQGGLLLAAGLDKSVVEKATVRRGLTDDQWKQIAN